MAEVKKKTVICDVFCGYAEESGNARFDQTMMRDIIAYYKFGHVVRAHAATHRGKPIPIGEDMTVAKTSEYDKARLQRLEEIQAAVQQEEEAERALREEEQSTAVAAATAAAAAADDDDYDAVQGQGKVGKERERKKRVTGGKQKARPNTDMHSEEFEKVQINIPEGTASGTQITITTPNGKEVIVTVPEGAEVGQELEVEIPIDVSLGTDRRGKLPYMRLLLKWTDGCGVQVYRPPSAPRSLPALITSR